MEVGWNEPVIGGVLCASGEFARTYADYLRTRHWFGVRKVVLRLVPFCEECGVESVPFEVHHKTYRNIGNEKLDDLQVLCNKCHKAAHHGSRLMSPFSEWRKRNGLVKKRAGRRLRVTVPMIAEAIGRNYQVVNRHVKNGRIDMGDLVSISRYVMGNLLVPKKGARRFVDI